MLPWKRRHKDHMPKLSFNVAKGAPKFKNERKLEDDKHTMTWLVQFFLYIQNLRLQKMLYTSINSHLPCLFDWQNVSKERALGYTQELG